MRRTQYIQGKGFPGSVNVFAILSLGKGIPDGKSRPVVQHHRADIFGYLGKFQFGLILVNKQF